MRQLVSKWVCVFGLILGLLAQGFPQPGLTAVADSPAVQPSKVSLLESGRGSMILELQVPALAQQQAQDSACHTLSAPGLASLGRPGRPVVPTRGVLLAVPTLAGLRLEVLDAAPQPLPPTALCSTPVYKVAPPLSPATVDTARQEPSVPGVYPEAPAEITYSGLVRGQPVAQIQFYPVQVDSARDSLLFYPRLRVRLWFDPSRVEVRPARTAGGAFDAILQAILFNPPPPAALPPAATGSPPAQPSVRPSAAFSETLKVFVDQDGMVQITPGHLAAAGWDPSAIDPRTLKLTHLGVELPLWVEDQNANNIFDGSDWLLFYGQAMTGPYTRRNVYWLTYGGADGLRMATRDADPVHGYPVPASFPATRHAEQDTAPDGYWQNPPGREAQDHWYWTGRLMAPASAGLPFQMPPFSTDVSSMTLRVLLAGQTDDHAHDPDHHTRLKVNGVLVGEAWWDGRIEYLQTAVITPTLFVTGSNTLTVETVGDTGAAVDTLYANWLEVDYQALYASQDDSLAFQAPAAGNYQFRIGGLSAAGVEVFDTTVPTAPVRLLNVQSLPANLEGSPSRAGSGYIAVLEDSATAASRYLALTPAQRRAPDGLLADLPSNLQDPANGADEIIIAYDGFYTDTLPLVAHRQGQGLRVQLVRITDVYDEFSGGIVTPQAIRDFLTYAYQSWAPQAPTYALLVGDASLDWLDRFGTGIPNFLPAYIFDAWEVGETAQDNWFACVDGDDALPDLFIGRLSAQTNADVQAMVSKTIAYETNPPTAGWATRTLWVADDDVDEFEDISDFWIGQFPSAYQPQRVYVGDYPPGNPQADIVSAINDGRFLVCYNGHGNQDRWGSWSGGQIFNTATVSQLTNADRLPFVVTATCLNGFFPNPLLSYCLAEELARKADGGAVAVWSPSALGWPLQHQVLFMELFDSLFGAPAATLGSITTQAKLAAAVQGVGQELLDTFVLFGDPALGLEVTAGHRVYLPLVLKGATGR